MPVWLLAVMGLGIAALVVIVILIYVLSDGKNNHRADRQE
jgi:hypothetical protein